MHNIRRKWRSHGGGHPISGRGAVAGCANTPLLMPQDGKQRQQAQEHWQLPRPSVAAKTSAWVQWPQAQRLRRQQPARTSTSSGTLCRFDARHRGSSIRRRRRSFRRPRRRRADAQQRPGDVGGTWRTHSATSSGRGQLGNLTDKQLGGPPSPASPASHSRRLRSRPGLVHTPGGSAAQRREFHCPEGLQSLAGRSAPNKP